MDVQSILWDKYNRMLASFIFLLKNNTAKYYNFRDKRRENVMVELSYLHKMNLLLGGKLFYGIFL